MSFEDHNNFFKRSVTGTFANSVYSTFDLARAIFDSGNAVCCCKSQIIMTMHRYNCLIYILDIFFQIQNF